MLLSRLSTKKHPLCVFDFPIKLFVSNAILKIILSKIFAKLVQVAIFLIWFCQRNKNLTNFPFCIFPNIFLQSTSESLAQNKPSQAAAKSIHMLLKGV